MVDEDKDVELSSESDEDLDVRADDGEAIKGGRWTAAESGAPDAARPRGKRRLERPIADAARKRQH